MKAIHKSSHKIKSVTVQEFMDLDKRNWIELKPHVYVKPVKPIIRLNLTEINQFLINGMVPRDTMNHNYYQKLKRTAFYRNMV